jgi:hypothetical protein
MDYRRNYNNVLSLADRIREGASQGKTTKAGGGLAARITPEPLPGEPDFQMVAANYIKDLQGMFPEATPRASLSEVQSYLDTLDSNQTIEALNAPSASTEGHTDNSLLSQLIYSESGGNPNATRVNKDGRRFSGLVQMGEARLEDYNKASGTTLKLDDFKGNPDLEREVISWHMRDLTKLAEEMSAKTGMDVNGLVAVGHLGGRTGMTKFAASGGKHNPQDELETSLMDYYTRFKSK